MGEHAVKKDIPLKERYRWVCRYPLRYCYGGGISQFIEFLSAVYTAVTH